MYIPGTLAPEVNAFFDHLNVFLNYHRPSLFPTEVINETGRVKRRYPQQDVATPFEKLASLPDARALLEARRHARLPQ